MKLPAEIWVIARYKRRLLIISGLIILSLAALPWLMEQPVSYQADVKPILNQKCISCHGGVRKKGGFSLLFREEALAATASGKPAIIPGDAVNSEMIRRLRHQDPEERMPYHKSPLSEDEISILERWINDGARFDMHWAYQPVRMPPPAGGFWKRMFRRQAPMEIDRYIDDKLEDIGLKRSAEADKASLLRRVALDLTGIPASEEAGLAFLSNKDAIAYETLVDSLLSSPRFGERWASMWLDLARYADTKGYEADQPRNIWRYRDWLIEALNSDMPYDRFLRDQIAGDLLPYPTNEQLIATAFHRNTLTNDEGGSDNEEFRLAAVMDRVNTTWEAVMGTSFACVQCHGHPYDPFRQEEYYQFMAYFNDSRDEDTNMDYPVLREFRGRSRAQYDSLMHWIRANADARTVQWYDRFLRTCSEAVNTIKADSLQNAAITSSWYLLLRKSSWGRVRTISFDDRQKLLIRYRCHNTGGVLRIYLDSAKGRMLASLPLKNEADGWNLFAFDLPGDLTGAHDLHLNYENPSLRSLDDNGIVFDWFATTPALPGRERMEDAYYTNMLMELINKPNAELTPILSENPGYLRRTTRVFERGNWLTPAKAVEPGIPDVLAISTGKAGKGRMALANWITDKNNPLTARTFVNRIWEQLFGMGLVESLEDLGSQGTMPSHPELLDLLSYRFMHDDRWSIKKLLKRIVMSETYRQGSATHEKGMSADPRNRYYWHAPRIRLSAEQLRDQALHVSGLLSKKMYGPSVMPFQPEGIWASPYNGMRWTLSQGEDKYRRAIYTYWKRSSPYPSMMQFDAVSREVCVSRRIRTNTPLQALTLMNDSAYWEPAVHLAIQTDSLIEGSIQQKIAHVYQKATGQEISEDKKKIMSALYQSSLNALMRKPEACLTILSGHAHDEHARSRLAAFATVVNAILNTDEVVTRS